MSRRETRIEILILASLAVSYDNFNVYTLLHQRKGNEKKKNLASFEYIHAKNKPFFNIFFIVVDVFCLYYG